MRVQKANRAISITLTLSVALISASSFAETSCEEKSATSIADLNGQVAEIDSVTKALFAQAPTNDTFDLHYCTQARAEYLKVNEDDQKYDEEVAKVFKPKDWEFAKYTNNDNTPYVPKYESFIRTLPDIQSAYKKNPFTERLQVLKNESDRCDLNLGRTYMNRLLEFGDQKPIHSTGVSNGVSVLSNESLEHIYSELLKNPYFPYELIESGNCYQRADVISAYLYKHGVSTGQVIARGELQAYAKVSKKKIPWVEHTALYVMSPRGGKLEKMVIDPSLSDHPLTVAEWAGKMKVNKPKSSPALEFKRSNGKEVSSWNRIKDAATGHEDMSTMEFASYKMLYDMFHLFENARSLPSRVPPELGSTLKEYAEFAYREELNLPKGQTQTGASPSR